MTGAEILDKILTYSGLNVKSLSEKIGLERPQALYDVQNGKTKRISSSMANRILSVFSEFNLNWLLTGEGEMLKGSSNKIENIEHSDSGVPYYENIDVAGSIVGMYNDYEKFPPTFFINYPHFNDCTAYLPVVGDSMYPKFASGEIIAVKRIFNLDMIQWGEPYMIVGNGNTDNLRTIKLVFPHEEAEKLVLRASNPNFKGDTPIDKSDILEMYIVKGKITRNQY